MGKPLELFSFDCLPIVLFCSFIQPGDHSISISSGWRSPHYRYNTTYCHHQTKNWCQTFVSTITLIVYS